MKTEKDILQATSGFRFGFDRICPELDGVVNQKKLQVTFVSPSDHLHLTPLMCWSQAGDDEVFVLRPELLGHDSDPIDLISPCVLRVLVRFALRCVGRVDKDVVGGDED